VVKIGIVGCGRGTSFARQLTPEGKSVIPAELVALCDQDHKRLEALGERCRVRKLYDDYDRLLEEDIDAVIVCTPPALHAPQSIAAMQAGKHVLSEVPATVSIQECWDLIRTVRETGKTYMFSENMCYAPIIRAWNKIVPAGKIGEVFYAEAEYVHDCRRIMGTPEDPTWRAYLAPIHYCTHSLGPILYLTGERCISAVGMMTGTHVTPKHSFISDMEVALFRLTNGGVIKILCGFSVEREPAFHYFTLYGTKGCIETGRGLDDKPKIYLKEGEPEHKIAPFEYEDDMPEAAKAAGHGGADFFVLREFVSSIEEGRPPEIDVVQGMEQTAPGICAHQSALENGKPVEIPNFRE